MGDKEDTNYKLMSKIILYDGFYNSVYIREDEPKVLDFLSDFFNAYYETDDDEDFDFDEWIEDYTDEDGVYLPKDWFHGFCYDLLREADVSVNMIDEDLESFIYEAGGREWDDDDDNYYVPKEAIEGASAD